MSAIVHTPPRLLGARQLLRLCAWLAASALVILWIGCATDIDLALADAVYDASIHAFPWRHTWLADTFNHTILKGVLTLAAAWFILAAVRDAWRPRAGRSDLDQLRLRVVGLSAVLVPVVISTLKQASVAHCPWDLARYGGTEPYLRLFEALPPGVAVATACRRDMRRVRYGWCRCACIGCRPARGARAGWCWWHCCLAAWSAGCSNCVARIS